MSYGPEEAEKIMKQVTEPLQVERPEIQNEDLVTLRPHQVMKCATLTNKDLNKKYQAARVVAPWFIVKERRIRNGKFPDTWHYQVFFSKKDPDNPYLYDRIPWCNEATLERYFERFHKKPEPKKTVEVSNGRKAGKTAAMQETWIDKIIRWFKKNI